MLGLWDLARLHGKLFISQGQLWTSKSSQGPSRCPWLSMHDPMTD